MIIKFYLSGNNLIYIVLFCLQYLFNEDYEGKKLEEIGKLEQIIFIQLKVKYIGIDKENLDFRNIEIIFICVFNVIYLVVRYFQ